MVFGPAQECFIYFNLTCFHLFFVVHRVSTSAAQPPKVLPDSKVGDKAWLILPSSSIYQTLRVISAIIV